MKTKDKHWTYGYSPRREELSIFDLAGDLLFTIHYDGDTAHASILAHIELFYPEDLELAKPHIYEYFIIDEDGNKKVFKVEKMYDDYSRRELANRLIVLDKEFGEILMYRKL